MSSSRSKSRTSPPSPPASSGCRNAAGRGSSSAPTSTAASCPPSSTCPRDRYTTNVRLRIEQELRETFDAVSIDYEARMTESALARLFFRIRLPKNADVSNVNSDELEKRLVRAARSWSEGIAEVLRARGDGAASRRTAPRNSPPSGPRRSRPSYRVDYEIEDALRGHRPLREVRCRRRTGRRSRQGAARRPRLPPRRRRSHAGRGRPGQALHAGAEEPEPDPAVLPQPGPRGPGRTPVRDRDRGPPGLLPLRPRPEVPGRRGPAQATGQLLGESFGAAVSGAVESDSFDRLVLREGMHWRQVVVLRAYAKYMRQMGNTNSYGFLADTLLANPDVNRGTQRPVRSPLRSRAQRRRPPAQAGRGPRRTGRGDRTGRDPRRRPRAAHVQEPDPGHAADQLLPEQAAPELQTGSVRRSRACRSRGRCSRSGSTRPGSRACTCASARWPAAACAGRTGARTSARKSWAW